MSNRFAGKAGATGPSPRLCPDHTYSPKGAGLLQYLATPLELVEIKAGSDGKMEFSAYASTFGNKDHGGDIIKKGAFKDSLKARNFRPLLWQHNMDQPIGIEKSLREDPKGLIGTWELVDTAQGNEAYKLLKAGAVRSMSIGYIPKDWEYERQGDEPEWMASRILKAVDLLENSVVSLPMNEQAQVQNVKKMVEDAVKAALGKKDEDDGEEKAVSYEEMTLAELAGVVSEVVDAFGVRTRGLLEKLSAGDFSLNESKRTDLQTLLETFSGLDSVRHEVETVLAQKSSTDPKPGVSALALAIQLRQRRLRARGVEI